MIQNRFPAAKAVMLCLLLMLPIFNLFAEGPVTITLIVTEIDGKTRRNALLKELMIQEGREYESLAILKKQINARVRDLRRRRIFKEFKLEMNADDPEAIEIFISLTDSFTLVPRPMIKYSSDRGLTLGLKVNYYNAFGTLTDQMFQGYWSPNEILFELETQKIILGPLHLDVALEQFDGTTRYGDPVGDTVVEYRNSRTQLSATLDIPLSAGHPWSYKLTPLVSWLYDYRFDFNDTGYLDTLFINNGFAPGLDHGLVTDQVNWIGNFRHGFYFDFMNKNLWYTETGNSDIFLESDLKAYLPLTSWFEISGRLGGFYAIDGIRKNAGDRLRGVVDYMTHGQFGTYFTFQANFELFHIPNLFSLHLRPFTDIGYVYSPLWEHGPDSWEYCLGATAIIYIDAMPSLNLNIDWGWDFKRGMPELIIDTVHFL